MASIVYGKDVELAPILDCRVAMLGYGNQGRPQARNLRDSGVQVIVGLHDSSQKRDVALADGFEVLSTAGAVQHADFLMLCLPDTKMAGIYREQIEPFLEPGHTICFCHGFNVRFGLIEPPAANDVVLVAPKGTGPSLRRDYEAGRGVPALAAVHQDESGQAWSRAFAYAAAVGAAKSFVLATSFSDETEADLFGEQAILCGGLPEMIKSGMQTLINAGIAPEIAYFECLHDCKTVLDLIYERGFAGMRSAISETAQWGGLKVGPSLVDDRMRASFEAVHGAIRDGSFASEWVDETESGMLRLQEMRAAERESSIESVVAEMIALRTEVQSS